MPANVTFNSGDTEAAITFAAAADNENDDGENVKLGFGALPTGVSEGTTKEATVSITDDDVPTVTANFEQATYTVDEGSTVTVTVTLNADPERTVTIPITKANQDGATSADYSGVPANVTFNSGDTEAEITFAAAADSENDDGENVKLGFGALPTGVSEGTTKEATVSITDDDVPTVTANFAQATYTVDEGSTVTVKVTLNADPERTVTIPDHQGQPGRGIGQRLLRRARQCHFQQRRHGSSDHLRRRRRQRQRRRREREAGLRGLAHGRERGYDERDDRLHHRRRRADRDRQLRAGAYTVDEGSTVTVTVTLNADPERTVTIPITKANQDGASNNDYSGVPANVTFNSGDTEAAITFAAAADNENDDNENVKLGFGALPTGVSEGTTKEATVSITDDDVPTVTANFAQATYTVDEGSTVTVTVTLNADPERTVTIPITKANQDGASNNDYSGVPANVTFNSGDTEAAITFAAAADSENDDGENVKLGFGALPTGVSEGTTKEATVSITDDDVPTVTANFAQATYTVDEGSTVTVTVTLNADPERTVTIPITKANQDGASNNDYSGVPANVTFNSGDTEAAITFAAAADKRQRRRREREAGLRGLAHGRERGYDERGDRLHHRRRRADRDRQLRAGDLHRGQRGQHRHRHRHAQRRPRAHRDHSLDHQGQPGRGIEGTMTTPACPPMSLSTAATRKQRSPSPPPPTARTTTERT